MRMCDLNTGLGQLTHAFADLRDRWAETKDQWHDDVGRQFEQNHLQPIPSRLQLLVAAVSRLTETLEQAEKELDDRPETLY
ncbi:MAG: hypothetical protein WEH44_03985 [Pirellulaceae bacterium]